MSVKTKALRAAFPYTTPILAGFLFLGFAYGLYMHSLGFSFVYPMLMSITIFAGSMEFMAATFLLSAFHPWFAFGMTLIINARHLFYGISMLEKFKGTGRKKWYLIFGMCDESFSIHCAAKIPDGVDNGWFMFFVTLLNQCYWVTGATLGGILGNFVNFDTKGLDFVMTALFVVIFAEQWLSTKQHIPAALGLIASLVCLLLFGPNAFILPAMGLILLCLTLLRGHLDAVNKKEASV